MVMETTRQKVDNLKERARIALIWTIHYWKELFNFRFDKYMIIQVLPGVYGLSLVAIACGLLYLCVEAFLQSTWRGLFYLFFAAPMAFLVLASILRALLEFYMVIFRISEHVDELVGIRDTVDRLSGIGDSVNEMTALTRRIPFWKALTRTRQQRSRVPDAARKRKELQQQAQQERDKPANSGNGNGTDENSQTDKS